MQKLRKTIYFFIVVLSFLFLISFSKNTIEAKDVACVPFYAVLKDNGDLVLINSVETYQTGQYYDYVFDDYGHEFTGTVFYVDEFYSWIE